MNKYPVIHKAYQFVVWYLKKDTWRQDGVLCPRAYFGTYTNSVFQKQTRILHENQYRIGLPLGNLRSQYFANYYLGKLDHYVKEMLSIKGYIGYVYDILVFGDSVKELQMRADSISLFLSSLRLRVHPLKIKFCETGVGFEFLGHKVYPTHFRGTSKNIRHARLNAHHRVSSHNGGKKRFKEAKNSLFSSIGFCQLVQIIKS